ncbi:hypothetical protein [Haliscomenobacter hydrossis]|uniref:Uncharacterized protein n=1 Tax=Haliscomenobacter hydrossis (strain ATCC 27775 / DSM 1100 / LMG 10767 / O) TaxID=760192 RepID=F4KQC8_HALH1|nr:hypothetical protein [Haliscomenobacter hydrossis]AEE48954.1 hypothetical protein Halhy_1055 [Haliscomenobacter hydrossis DSM 1100]
MCWCVTIATSAPLSGVTVSGPWPEDGSPPPPLHFAAISAEEFKGELIALYRSFFKGQFLYDVGSDTGCGCGLNRSYKTIYYEGTTTQVDYSDESPLALIEFIRKHTQAEDLEMYVVWETDRLKAPLSYVEIDCSTLNIDTYFEFESRIFYRFF